MFPKQIIIKSRSKNFSHLLKDELNAIPSIRYIHHKANGFYTTSIKCANYYKKINCTNDTSFYGSYIYLYTNVSLILSDIFMKHYERYLITRFIKMNYFYFTNEEQKQIFNISSSLLDPSSPIERNGNLYLSRKEILLNYLLENFRNKNHINVESFFNFSVPNYTRKVEDIIDTAVEIYSYDINYIELIKYILENWLITP